MGFGSTIQILTTNLSSRMGEGFEIPNDVLSQIFLRLRVPKSVFRLIGVSKARRNMISLDRDFIQKHYLLAQQNPECKHRIRIETSSVMIDETPITPTFLNDTVENSNLEILASCNGILLVGFGVDSLHLWNPFTGYYKKLGVSANMYHCRHRIRMYGLVFDSSCKDFVVIRIIRLKTITYGSGSCYDKTTIRIYNSRTSSWERKRNDEFPYEVYRNQKGVFWNGYTHWVVTRPAERGMEDGAMVVIYYDPADDKFKELGFPVFSLDFFCFTTFDGHLCLYVTGYKDYAWVLKEIGGPWIRMTPEEWVQVEQLNDHNSPDFGIACCVETLLSPRISSLTYTQSIGLRIS